MKKALIYFILFFTSLSSMGQDSTSKESITVDDYLLKSKQQKRDAWILLGSGVAMIGAVVLIDSKEEEFHLHKYVKSRVLGVAGIVTSLVSIHFFVNSHRNKKKSMIISPSIGTLKQPLGMQSKQARVFSTGFALRMTF